MNAILSPLFKLALPTLVRQVIAAAGAYFAVANPHDLTALITGIAAWALMAGWSFIEQWIAAKGWTKAIGIDKAQSQSLIWMIAGAIGSQAVSGIAGVLAHHGYGGDPNDALAVTLWGANYGLSVSQKAKAAGVKLDTKELVVGAARLLLLCILPVGFYCLGLILVVQPMMRAAADPPPISNDDEPSADALPLPAPQWSLDDMRSANLITCRLLGDPVRVQIPRLGED